MSGIVTPADLKRARRAVRVVGQRGSVTEEELTAVLGCTWVEARRAMAIARRWRKVDYCNGFLVPAAAGEGGEAA